MFCLKYQNVDGWQAEQSTRHGRKELSDTLFRCQYCMNYSLFMIELERYLLCFV